MSRERFPPSIMRFSHGVERRGGFLGSSVGLGAWSSDISKEVLADTDGCFGCAGAGVNWLALCSSHERSVDEGAMSPCGTLSGSIFKVLPQSLQL